MIAAALLLTFATAPDPLADWAGTWSGTLNLDVDGTKSVPMTLAITPADAKYGWKIEYGVEKGKPTVKDYDLLPVAGKPGFYEMDEKNGIKLLGRKAGNSLRFVYQMQTQLFEVRYTKAAAGINFELNVSDLAKAVESKVVELDLKILSFPPAAFQSADLVKK